MKMKCISPYRCRDVVFAVGAIFDATPEERLFLKADAPGCFEDYVEPVPEVKAVREPPMDKAIKEPPAAKTTPRRRRR